MTPPVPFPARRRLAAWIASAVMLLPALRAANAPDASFFQHCVFVCVDVQEPGPRHHMRPEEMPNEWVQFGFTVEDVNAAVDYSYDVAYPNSRRVADGCRRLGLPMVFIHWGCLYRDGMDLDPVIRQSFLAQHGPDYAKWGHHLTDPGSRPAALLGVREGEYVLPKTGQDGFNSSNLPFLLTNLGAKNLVFIGGHTGACLGKTAASAKRLGYRILVVEDATFDARQTGRLKCLAETGYDYTVTTDQFLRLVESVTAARR